MRAVAAAAQQGRGQRRYQQEPGAADQEGRGRSAAGGGSPERTGTWRWPQRGILCQDRPLQLPERRAWLDPQLIDQRAASRLVALERVGLAAAPVQREHQLQVEALANRVLAHQRFELADQRRVLAEREVRLDSVLERGQPVLLQLRRRALGKYLEGEILERAAAPQCKRLAESIARVLRPPGTQRLPGLGDERVEAVEVELSKARPQQIAVPLRHEQAVAERLAQIRHVDLNRFGAGRGRPLPPQLVDQAISRDDLAAVKQQDGEHGPLLRTPQHQPPVALDGLKRSQDPKLDHAAFSLATTLPPRPSLRQAAAAATLAGLKPAPTAPLPAASTVRTEPADQRGRQPRQAAQMRT